METIIELVQTIPYIPVTEHLAPLFAYGRLALAYVIANLS